jgi:hypothetical protein
VAHRPKKTTLGARLASPDHLFLDFIGEMLHVNPDERLSATQVCAARQWNTAFSSFAG